MEFSNARVSVWYHSRLFLRLRELVKTKGGEITPNPLIHKSQISEKTKKSLKRYNFDKKPDNHSLLAN